MKRLRGFKSLKAKLVGVLMVLVSIILIVQGGASIFLSQKGLEENTKENMALQAEQLGNILINNEKNVQSFEERLHSQNDVALKGQVETAYGILEYYYNLYSSDKITEEEAMEQARNTITKLFYGQEGYFWIDDKNYNVVLDPLNPSSVGDNREQFKSEDGVQIYKQLVDESVSEGESFQQFQLNKNGSAVTYRSYSKHFNPWGWIIGTKIDTSSIDSQVMFTKEDQSYEFQERIESMSIDGTVGVLIPSGEFLYYTDAGWNGTQQEIKDAENGQNVVDKLINIKNGYVNFTDDKEKFESLAYVHHVPEMNAFVFITKNTKALFAQVEKQTQYLLMIIGGSLLLTLFITYLIAHSFVKPIKILRDGSKKIRDGDLDITIPVKRKDEIGELGQSFNEMTTHLKQLVNRSQSISDHVENTSSQLNETVEQTAASLEQVSSAVDAIASGATDQAHKTQHGVDVIESFGQVTSNIRGTSEKIRTSSQQVQDKSKDGIEIVNHLLSKQNESQTAMEQMEGVMESLTIQINKIHEFTQVITDISEQTNLLALNAAIEAARAGEHGKGFAVVANEVRRLAEQSSTAAKNVEEVIASVNKEAMVALETTNKTVQTFEEQGKSVKQTNVIFTNLQSTIDEAGKNFELIHEQINDLQDIKDQITYMMQEINDVTEQTASSTEQVSASIEEQTASMNEIHSSMRDLHNQAKELKMAINKFKL